MSDEPQRIYANDHTGLRDRPKRLWSIFNAPIPVIGSVSIPGMVAALAAFALICVIGSVLGGFLGSGSVTVACYLFALVVAVATYLLWGKPVASKMPILSAAAVWLDWKFRQPRDLHGFVRDTEPTVVEWHLIMWRPTDPGWLAAYDHTLTHLRHKAGEGPGTTTGGDCTRHSHTEAVTADPRGLAETAAHRTSTQIGG